MATANAVHHRTSTRLGQVVPDFIQSEHPQFYQFLQGYYEFLEQVDNDPVTSTFTPQAGVVTVTSGRSTIVGGETDFTTLSPYDTIKIGSDVFRVREVTNATSLVVYDVPIRTYFANTYSVESNISTRQAAGALRQLLYYKDPATTLNDFEAFFRDTYLRDLPQGELPTSVLVDHIIDFYQARGSEAAYRFLFRALYNEDVQFTYPRDYVFRTSDGDYERSTSITVTLDDPSVDATTLETRQIVGLTSRARATVLRALNTYIGNQKYATLFVDEIVENQETGDILLNSNNPLDDGDRLILTAFGTPPEGLSSSVYEYVLTQETVVGSEFQAGEPFSTVPTNDPIAVTGAIAGSVVGFRVVESGSGYSLGDVVVVPVGGDGAGASGRVSVLVSTDITDISIIDGGEGYVQNLPLVVDNSGTGGTGLQGYVSRVFPGALLMEDDGQLLFDAVESTGAIDGDIASRETVDYYEVGLSMSELFAVNPTLSDVTWSTNVASALYGVNLSTSIERIMSQLSVKPIYVGGVRTAVGQVRAITLVSPGDGYRIRPPSVGVATPPTLSDDVGAPLSSTILADIMGGSLNVPYRTAEVEPQLAVGQIGFVEVSTPGAGYTSSSEFAVATGSGEGAVLELVLGGLYTSPTGRFRNSRGQTSSDQHLQDITKYQPFSYILTVEKDISDYYDVVQRHLHPAGGLLLGRQTVTSEVDVAMVASAAAIAIGDSEADPVDDGDLLGQMGYGDGL